MLDLYMAEVNGLRMLVRNGNYNHIDTYVLNEVQQAYFWDRFNVSKVRYAIDIGAHIGAWTRYLKLRVPDAQVICIEASSENAWMLLANTFHTPGTFKYHARGGYEEGDFVLARHDLNSGGHRVVKRGTVPADPHLVAEELPPLLTLETVCERHKFPRIDVLKLDCEGAEWEIIMQTTLLKKIGRIVGEYHYDQREFDAVAGERLRQHGFKIEYLPNSTIDQLGMFYAHKDN